jgi:hypothetical protein
LAPALRAPSPAAPPARPRATLILKKGADHLIETVALRRL